MKTKKNLLTIQRISRNNFGAKGSNLTKLFRVTCREVGMIVWVRILGACTPNILEGKKRPKFGAISDNFRFDRECLRDGLSNRQAENRLSSTISSTYNQKNWWTSVHWQKRLRG